MKQIGLALLSLLLTARVGIAKGKMDGPDPLQELREKDSRELGGLNLLS